MKLSVTTDKSCYTPNENCIMTVSADCDSSELDIEQIDIFLDNYITLTCSTGYSKTFTNSILRTTL